MRSRSCRWDQYYGGLLYQSERRMKRRGTPQEAGCTYLTMSVGNCYRVLTFWISSPFQNSSKKDLCSDERGQLSATFKKISSKSDEKKLKLFSKICSKDFRYFLHGKGKGFALCMVKYLHCMVNDLHCTVTAVRDLKNLEHIFEKSFIFFRRILMIIF